jgi:hypothetical protein
LARRHGPAEVMTALMTGQAVEPGSYYFCGTTFFETTDERYAWMTKHIVICTGQREPATVTLQFYKVA